jgi:hypothetical protein
MSQSAKKMGECKGGFLWGKSRHIVCLLINYPRITKKIVLQQLLPRKGTQRMTKQGRSQVKETPKFVGLCELGVWEVMKNEMTRVPFRAKLGKM